MDVSPDCCDLFSVSHFLCSYVVKKYVGYRVIQHRLSIFVCVLRKLFPTFGKGPSTKHCWSK